MGIDITNKLIKTASNILYDKIISYEWINFYDKAQEVLKFLLSGKIYLNS